MMAVSYVSYETAVQAYAVRRAKRRDIPTLFFARGRGETQRVGDRSRRGPVPLP